MPKAKTKAQSKPGIGKDVKTGRFQKGHPGFRPKGENRITKDIKEGLTAAAARVGYDGKGKDGLVGYLQMLAEDYPKQFAPLLGRLMPLQINATPGSFIGAVNIVGVPKDHYLSAEQVRAMQPDYDQPKVIDITSRMVSIDDEPVEPTASDVA